MLVCFFRRWCSAWAWYLESKTLPCSASRQTRLCVGPETRFFVAHHIQSASDSTLDTVVVCFFRRWCSASAWYLLENTVANPQSERLLARQEKYLFAHHHTLSDPEVDAVVEPLVDNLSIDRKLTSTILQVCRVSDLHHLSALSLASGML